MADDLRIIARVDDQFTGPLGKLKGELKSVGDETAKHGALWKKDWASARQEVDKFRGVLTGFTPILSSIGMGGFGAALSLGGIATALKSFSGQTRDLSQMGRQIGMTVDQLRTLGSLGERFGVSADTMKAAIGQFATNMVDLRQRWGQVYGELRSMNLGTLAEDLVNAPNMQAGIEAVMKTLQSMPDSMKAARLSTLIFGTPDMATIARSITGKIGDALKQTQADIGHLDKETEESARRFEEHFARIGRAAEKLKLKVLGPLLKGTADLLDDAEKNGLSGNDGERALREQLSPFGGAPPTTQQKLEGRRTQVEQQLKLLESGPRDKDYQRKHDRMVEEMKRVADELQKVREQGGASYSPSGFSGSGAGGGGSLIQKAAWGGMGSSDGLGGMRDRYPVPDYGSASPGAKSSYGAGEGSSTRSGSRRDVPSAPDIGGGIRGRPFGYKGPLTSESLGIGQGANPGDYKDVLDFIAKSEGTANRPGDGYNTSLAYGKLLPGGVEQVLTGKTLNEIDALQTQMLRSPHNRWNSSAIGRYQIVRTTLRRLRKKLGLNGDDRYDEGMQDRLAAELARARGPNAHALHQEWASLTGEKGRHAAELMGRIPRSASIKPSLRPEASARVSMPVGNALMDRFYGKGAAGGGPAMQMPGNLGGAGRGTLHIKVDGPPGTQVKHEMGDLFSDTKVSKGPSQMDMDRA